VILYGLTQRQLHNIRPRGARRGVALLIVLMVTAILTVVVLDFAESTRINFYIASNISDGMRAYYMAKSGVQVAEGALLKDMQGTKDDYLGEDWNNPIFNYIPISDREAISVTITDESSKFNLNNLVGPTGTVNQAQYDILKKLLENLNLDVTIADAITDWIDKDDQALQGGGSESDFYGYSSAQPQAYMTKNAKLLSLGEIKLIKGVSEDVYNQLAQVCTIYSDNRYNINTINDKVLTALIQGTDEQANAQDFVTKIDNFRNDTNNYFEQGKMQQQLISLGVDQTMVTKIGRKLATTSRYFSVDVTANVGSTLKSVHAVVQRTKKKVKLIYFRPGERLRPIPSVPGAATTPGAGGQTGQVPGMTGLGGSSGGLNFGLGAH